MKGRKKYRARVLVPDTSVIIRGIVSKYLSESRLSPKKIIFHEAVMGELEHQANMNKTIGKDGLEEIRRIRSVCRKKKIKVVFSGRRPSPEEIKFAKKGGEIDALIRKTAYDEKATLITADRVQAMVAKSKGIRSIFIKTKRKKGKSIVAKYFKKGVYKVYVREAQKVLVKIGKPGYWKLKEEGRKVTKRKIEELCDEIFEEAVRRKDSFVKSDKRGFAHLQIDKYDVVIIRPPLSDFTEVIITKFYNMRKYKLDFRVRKAMKGARGVLVAGKRRDGKNRFIQGMINNLERKDMVAVVKESGEVKGLNLSGSVRESVEIIMSINPDYVIFENLDNHAISVFSEIGLRGVKTVAAIDAKDIDSAMLLLGTKTEREIIKRIVDVIIFIEKGKVREIRRLEDD